MAESLFEELKRYVAFDGHDEQALRALHPVAQPHFETIAQVFYDRILSHEEARKALVGGESSVGRLKVTLVQWMDKLLKGPWDEAYYELRCRIGRVHVRINLPQHYMFGAMNVVRQQLDLLIDSAPFDEQARQRGRVALGKVLDLETAIMLHTYREDLLAQQARQERLATFGQLLGSIGHELRNPLGVIETSLFIIKGRTTADERSQKHVDRIGLQLAIANKIISDLLDMIRDRPLHKTAQTTGTLVEDAAQAVPRPESVALVLRELRALPPVEGDQGQLRQVFVNLITNAVQAARTTVWVTGEPLEGFVCVRVDDDGPGIDENTRRRLFEPLITTKEKGIGLGLALVKRIVDRHEGSITYEPRDGGGARFVVRLPAAKV